MEDVVAEPPKLGLKLKALAYIIGTYQARPHLLIIEHPHHPEAGLQVPGGSARSGEPLALTALREAEEETGLTQLRLVRRLGTTWMEMSPWGIFQRHQRAFFHLEMTTPLQDLSPWTTWELDPGDGSAPHEFLCRWAPLDNLPELIAGHDSLVPLLSIP